MHKHGAKVLEPLYLAAGLLYYATHGAGRYAHLLAIIGLSALGVRIIASFVLLSRSKILGRNLDYFLAVIQRKCLIEDFVFTLLCEKDLSLWVRTNAPRFESKTFVNYLRDLPSRLR